MSVKSKDISYDVTDAIYDMIATVSYGSIGEKGFIFIRKDKIILAGTGGTATITNNGVVKTATFEVSLKFTAWRFVNLNAPAYLAVGVTLTDSEGVLSFVHNTKGGSFSGNTTIVNATTNLAGTVAADNTVYPVYKAIPKDPAQIYVRLGEVVEREDGTKDDFVYRGSIPVITCDESQLTQADKKKAQNINNVIRGILKPSKASVPTGFIQFGHEGKTEYIDMNEEARPLIRLVDIYGFIIE